MSVLPAATDVARLERRLRRRFRTCETAVEVAGRRLTILHPASAEDLISEDDFERDERLPYWAELWPSARVLAAHLAGSEGAGRTLVELGCGSGLVTAAALVAGFSVTATDYYEDALRFTRVNGWRASGREPETRIADWRALPAALPRAELVVGADVLYERPYGPLVARALARTLLPDGLGIIADPGRVAVEAFVSALPAEGLRLTAREAVPYKDGAVRQTITLLVVRTARRAAPAPRARRAG
ncbi:MAG TPA: class I SAM-dependent methyltransferase [Gemmatimonadaceae bacterium]|nr:class I SAM-dependent methyltransferase [Gemmatimonadaceae bacterium]